MNKRHQYTKYGTFSIAGRDVFGELRVAGEASQLCLRDAHFFDAFMTSGNCVTGVLHDLTKVTLIECLSAGAGTTSRVDGAYYHANVFPHFVLEGKCHIEPADNVIVGIRFVIDDASALFYDFDAFSSLLDPAPFIGAIVAANKVGRPVETGPDPRIAYFTGKRSIVELDTEVGRVTVEHNPTWDLGGPKGVRIDNTISVTLEPQTAICFDEAVDRLLRLLRFFQLVIGRPQNLDELSVDVKVGLEPHPLKVHWSHCPKREGSDKESDPHPADLLLDPIRRSKEFADVMTAWFEKDKERLDARQRFDVSFAHLRSYSVDRLIGAANMFDILPDLAAPKDVKLSNDLIEATQLCRQIFKKLPDSYERSSVLNTLGRVGKASLKHKVRHRTQYIIANVGERFPDLVEVLDEAINCRNHYVHGTASKIDYNQNIDLLPFFTDSLEFVFAASELIEAGWDITVFVKNPTTGSHPFGSYKSSYTQRLQAFKTIRKR